MHTEMKDITIGPLASSQPTRSPDDDPVWQALISSQISMPLHKILQLLPRLKDIVVSLTTGKEPTTMPIHLAELGTGPPLMDSQNPTVKLVIKGQAVNDCIIDDGSGVNVIS